MYRNFHWKWTLIALLIGITAFAPFKVMDYGISSPTAILAYLNGNFPDENASTYSWVNTINFGIQNVITSRKIPGTTKIAFGTIQGMIYTLDFSQPNPSPVLLGDIAPTYNFANNRYGLKGIAFHPEFGQANSPNRNYIYVSYLTQQTNARLSRFTISASTNQLIVASEQVMIEQIVPGGSFHSIGEIDFGPDGFLYVPFGDGHGGSFGPYAGTNLATHIMNMVQRIDHNLIGGLMRIDVDKDPSKSHAPRKFLPGEFPAGISGQGYWIPNDNPWLAADGSIMEEYFSLGHRNPWKMIIDPVTGNPWLSEVGPHNGEELNRIVKGHNYGWPYRVGPSGQITWDRTPPTDPEPSPFLGVLTEPVFSPVRGDARSISLGCVYRGSKFPELEGWAVCSDVGTNKSWAANYDTLSNSSSVISLPNLPMNSWEIFEDFEGNIIAIGTNGVFKKLQKNSSTGGNIPQFLSQTGAFTNLSTLSPSDGIIPYTVNAPLWSDGAKKKRWIAVPNNGSYNTAAEDIVFDENDPWGFPAGTVFIKHFEMPLDENNPSLVKRLETRFIIQDKNGGIYGLTYKWNASGTDAELLTDSDTEPYAITHANGSVSHRVWEFPSRSDCKTCHNENAGSILGINTHQLNGDFLFPSGELDNQLRTWNHLGIFDISLNEADIPHYLATVNIQDENASLEERVRSYLDANCAHCHRPNGVSANFDARFRTPLNRQGLINGSLVGSYGIGGEVVVKPQDTTKSILFVRDKSIASDAMPPLAKSVVDKDYIKVLGEWIGSIQPPPLPGGVVSDLQLWLKADKGVVGTTHVSQWVDQSPQGNDASETSAQPEQIAEAGNYNPGIRFALNDVLSGSNPLIPGDNTHSFFLVSSNIGSVGAWPDIFRYSSTGSRVEFRTSTSAIGIAGGGGASTPTLPLNQSNIFSLASDAINDTGYGNGTVGTIRSSIAITSSGPYVLGSTQFNGSIMEIIAYGDELSNTARHKVESYLALKYGITLPHNYYASNYDGTGSGTQLHPIWDVLVNSSYTRDVTGIGRDDKSALDQRQSKSRNTGSLLEIYHGDVSASFPTINTANNHAFPNDKSFLIWGNNGASIAGLNASIQGGTQNAVSRIWKVAETGGVGKVSLRVRKSSLPAGITVLYVNKSDTSFPNNSGTKKIAMEDDGGNYLYALADFSDGDFFTFGDGAPTSTYSLSIKAFLEGPFDSDEDLMDDFYRTDGHLATTDPYGLGVSMDAGLLADVSTNAIIDWVKVELRDANDPGVVLAETAALMQRDGDLMDKDGNATITFEGLSGASFYVALKHYNHLGVMTASAMDLSASPHIDFSLPGTPVYSLGGQAQENRNGTMIMWAGDADGDGNINAIDQNLYWRVQNGSTFSYGSSTADFNLNGIINAVDLNIYWRFNNSLVEQVP